VGAIGAKEAAVMTRIALYDTTLRDGTQRAGLSLSLRDKWRIARLLDHMGMDFVEGGWPGSNPTDAAVFGKERPDLAHSRWAAFGSTARLGVGPDDDPQLRALAAANTPVVTIFGKASALHATDILGGTREANLAAVAASVRWLAAQGRAVVFDAEHFFDGARLDRGYAWAVLEAAAEAGASWLVLCDTNGGSLPDWVAALTEEVVGRFAVPVGIHAHDDGGLAVANSLAAVDAGATMVQGTVNGYGERCGNANLCTVWANLVLKRGRAAGIPERLAELTHLAHTVAEIANLPLDPGTPYVGDNAFTHKGGVHVSAVRKLPAAYEHVPPETVGQTRRVVVSDLSGRSNLLYHFPELDETAGAAAELTAAVKDLGAAGFTFEEGEASLALLVSRRRGEVPEYYTVDRYKVTTWGAEAPATEATVRVRIGERVVLSAAEGDGPVHSLDLALRRTLLDVYPILADWHLTDYKVRVLDGVDGTAARVRVGVESRWHDDVIRTVGVSRNIIEASWQALRDAVDYVLWRAAVPAPERPVSAAE
jgi:2-isopropylmalate synthase